MAARTSAFTTLSGIAYDALRETENSTIRLPGRMFSTTMEPGGSPRMASKSSTTLVRMTGSLKMRSHMLPLRRTVCCEA